MTATPLRDHLLAALRAGLAAAAPAPLVERALAELPRELARRPRTVLAVGKAAFGMLEGAAAGGWDRALAIGPEAPHRSWPRAEVRVGSHPAIDERSVEAAALARALVDATPAEGLLVALISGGTSAMLAEPRPGLSLGEKARRTAAAMASGLPIAELNALRSELSAIKGGQLVAPSRAPVLTLLVSDVAGDDPRVIGSGLTISGAASPLLDEWHLPTLSPPRAGDRFRVLANQETVARAAAAELIARGLAVAYLPLPLQGTVEETAKRLVAALAGSGRRAVVAFGEPTVRLPDHFGSGGRAQQLALLLARELCGGQVTALVAGTDGADGPSLPPAAGAVVDGQSWARVGALGIDGERALARCDARPVLEALGELLMLGRTGVNHADVMLLATED